MNAAPCSWRVVMWRGGRPRRLGSRRFAQRLENVHRLLAGHREDVLDALGSQAVDEELAAVARGRSRGERSSRSRRWSIWPMAPRRRTGIVRGTDHRGGGPELVTRRRRTSPRSLLAPGRRDPLMAAVAAAGPGDRPRPSTAPCGRPGRDGCDAVPGRVLVHAVRPDPRQAARAGSTAIPARLSDAGPGAVVDDLPVGTAGLLRSRVRSSRPARLSRPRCRSRTTSFADDQ